MAPSRQHERGRSGGGVLRQVLLEGFAFPQQLAAGLSWRASENWLWAIKLEWLNWSDALRSATLTASDPEHPAAPSELSQTQTLGWRDQWVIAIGVAARPDAVHTLRAGVNYGRNPIPAERSNPLLNAIGEKHITLGISRKLDRSYELLTGIEYQLRNRVTYSNPELPFGAAAEVRNEHVACHFMLSRRW